ncbi:MAG: hypothetical protein ACPL4E_03520 [Thermoproteota archaeon]
MKVLEGDFRFRLPNGEPVSFIKLEDGRKLLLKGDVLIENIGGKKVVKMEKPLDFLPDGTLVGFVKLEDGKWVPFRGNELLEEVVDKKSLA